MSSIHTDRSTSPLLTDSLLVTTAAIWGFAFVAQRVGMQSVGPFLFNGIRFALGAVTLIPFLIRRTHRRTAVAPTRFYLMAGTVSGGALFLGSSFQQMGLVYTTAGKAGFITGLYVVLVPLLGIFFGSRPGAVRWIGALLAVAGLYLLSIQESLRIEAGDLLVAVSALFFAVHVLVLSAYSPKGDPLLLALVQYLVCSLLSLAVGLYVETNTLAGVMTAAIPIIYGGCFSVGVAYTLQIMAQRDAHPAHAAIILSLEGVFAAFGGWLLIGETLSGRGIAGCLLMLLGMVMSQTAGTRLAARRGTHRG